VTSLESSADLPGRTQQVVDGVPSPLAIEPLRGTAHGEHAEKFAPDLAEHVLAAAAEISQRHGYPRRG
jgi:hypothetical protein